MDAPSHLRELASTYAMTYHVLPEWGSDERWRQQRIGFQVEIHAALRSGADPDSGSAPEAAPSPNDERTHASYAALRDVAAWAFGGERPDVSVSMDPACCSVVREPGRSAWAAELIGHVLHQGDVRRATDEAEQRYLHEVRERLLSLGIAER